jgi:hypothetical protein
VRPRWRISRSPPPDLRRAAGSRTERTKGDRRATRGIGRAIAETFADEGCYVGICARDEASVDATVAALRRKERPPAPLSMSETARP